MAILRVHEYGEPVLRKKARPVNKIDAEIQKLIKDMRQTMYESGGIGLAAPQVGRDIQLVVVDIGDGFWELINPRVTGKEGRCVMEEGCLSIPGINLKVQRASRISVEALNRHGEKLRLEARELFARVLQHEIDHLRGVLMIDYLNLPQRRAIETERKKWLKKTPKM